MILKENIEKLKKELMMAANLLYEAQNVFEVLLIDEDLKNLQFQRNILQFNNQMKYIFEILNGEIHD